MDDSTQPTFAAGQILAGKYRIERLIGQGGMGVVLAARHEALNTNVAIKLLRTAALQHTDIVGRFMREARAAVSLRSEHVARVFDVGTLDDGRPYIVMERLEGKDLGEVCEAPIRPVVGDAVDYVVQACEAIAEAHAAGIIHRDLKPKNLFLTRSVSGAPLVKVLDFGISKMDPQKSPGEMQLTRTTEVIGSPSYMSPEQLRSARNVDVRTDIWALGVILYELLTGRVPFYAETMTELVLVVVTEQQPPIRVIRPEVPEGLEAIVNRCLAKDPNQRFQSVVELVQALEPYGRGVQASASDRIRAVASGSSTGNPPRISITPRAGASQPGLPLPAHSSGAQLNVHAATAAAWADTRSAMQPLPLQPAPRSNIPWLISVATMVVVMLLGMGAIAVYKTRSASSAPPAATTSVPAANESAMPLPPGRKDLPPTPAPTLQNPDPPAASGLPNERKPGPAPTVAAPTKPTPKPAPAPKSTSTDLDGIGRN